ncbi:MAG TPA: hypothetical protein VLE49_22890, partial [Anaerolineales bacterium]|nr:hypothetical protein [Anaerolineales bacterium]
MIHVLLNVSSPALRAGLRALLSSDKTIKVVNDALDEEREADVVITSASHASFSDNGVDSPSSAATLLLSDDPLNVREMRRSFR